MILAEGILKWLLGGGDNFDSGETQLLFPNFKEELTFQFDYYFNKVQYSNP